MSSNSSTWRGAHGGAAVRKPRPAGATLPDDQLPAGRNGPARPDRRQRSSPLTSKARYRPPRIQAGTTRRCVGLPSSAPRRPRRSSQRSSIGGATSALFAYATDWHHTVFAPKDTTYQVVDLSVDDVVVDAIPVSHTLPVLSKRVVVRGRNGMRRHRVILGLRQRTTDGETAPTLTRFAATLRSLGQPIPCCVRSFPLPRNECTRRTTTGITRLGAGWRWRVRPIRALIGTTQSQAGREPPGSCSAPAREEQTWLRRTRWCCTTKGDLGGGEGGGGLPDPATPAGRSICASSTGDAISGSTRLSGEQQSGCVVVEAGSAR